MNTYELFGTSGWVYIGKSSINLEKRMRLYRVLNKSFQLSDCVMIHPVSEKDTDLGFRLKNRDSLLKAYQERCECPGFDESPIISARSIESLVKLD